MITKKQKILIVDDDQFLLSIYTLKFAKDGFEVITATKGEEAMEKLRGGLDPDILMLDVIMPSFDGFELLENARKEKLIKKAVIIMLTNQGQRSDHDRADKMNVDSYILKANTTPSEVLEKVIEVYNKKTNK